MTRAEAYWILHEMMVETFSVDQSKALSMALHDIQFVDLMPNDMVPVVRCQYCAYFAEAKFNNKGFLICPASGMEITGMDYCSYGERKEADGDDPN